MARKNKLSIYLIRDEFAQHDSLILKDLGKEKYPFRVIDNVGTVYFVASHTNTPGWVTTFFHNKLDASDIFTSNARAILISRIITAAGEHKTFAIAMGYGKSMLADDVIEDDFGLKVVLNTIPPNSLRKINKTNIGGNQKTSNEQLPLESGIDDFGYDIDRDLISAITGRSDDENFATGILYGSELLSLAADVDIYNLSNFLRIAYSQYISSEYKKFFSWIDHIKKVKDSRVVDALDAELVNLINADSPKIWMAVPEVIPWENTRGFKYDGPELHNDINISLVKTSFKHGLTRIDQLKTKHINAISSDDDTIYNHWSAYKCVYGEVSYGGKEYCINNGRWFCIDRDFVRRVNEDYNQMQISGIEFIPCTDPEQKESDYTEAFVATNPGFLLNMDRKVISHGGGQSRVELCDILTTDGTYIHIKPYSGPATLSHLFNQAVVSAELLLSDSEFFLKANQKIKEQTNNKSFLIRKSSKPNIVFAIISDQQRLRPHIPFFSKVALRYTCRRLLTDGCQVSIKNIYRPKR